MTGFETTIIGAILGGGIALTSNGLAARNNTKATRLTNEAQAARDKEERHQQRVENAYVEIQTHLTKCLEYVGECMTRWADDDDGEVPGRPFLEESRESAARLHAVKPVLDQWDFFEAQFRNFNALVHHYRTQKRDATTGLPGALADKQTAYQQMGQMGEAMRDFAESLFRLMQADLNT